MNEFQSFLNSWNARTDGSRRVVHDTLHYSEYFRLDSRERTIQSSYLVLLFRVLRALSLSPGDFKHLS